MKKNKVLILELLYILYIAIPSYLLLLNNQSEFLYTLGKLFGVIGISLLALQPVLSSRLRLLEKGVGYNNIINFHKINSIAFMSLLIIHPMLINVSLIQIGVSPIQNFKDFSVSYLLGIGSLTIIIFTIFITLLSDKIKIKYERWKLLHKLTYAILIWGFLHSFFIGSDIATGILFYWWLFILTLVVLSFIYRYGLRKLILRNSIYEISEIKMESKDVRTIKFKPLNAEMLKYQPGQFAYVTFLSKNLPQEEHHFTLSSSPSDDYLSFTIKESGDYTSLLGRLKAGDKLRLEGPFGVFTNININPPYFMIAGGIGITPLISMLRTARKAGMLKNYILVYSNKELKDILFKNELGLMVKEGLKVYYVLSRQNVKGYYSGRLDKILLKKLIKGHRNANYFVVGPASMNKSVKSILISLKVDSDNIYLEKFSLK